MANWDKIRHVFNQEFYDSLMRDCSKDGTGSEFHFLMTEQELFDKKEELKKE